MPSSNRVFLRFLLACAPELDPLELVKSFPIQTSHYDPMTFLGSFSRRSDVERALVAHQQETSAKVVPLYTGLAQVVRARYIAAASKPAIRQDAVHDTNPINKPHGIDPAIVRENGRTEYHREDTVKPAKKDITPEDVFAGTPNQMGVLNFAETGKDLSEVLRTKVPKDRGYDAVSQLSQYLIETGGGGGAKAVPKRK